MDKPAKDEIKTISFNDKGETTVNQLKESLAYCAKITSEHGGPQSFGGALLFNHHAAILRKTENCLFARKLLFCLYGLDDDQIDYILNRSWVGVRDSK